MSAPTRDRDEPDIPRGDSGLRIGAIYALARYLVRVALILVYRVRVFGVERIPRRGSVVLASNHASTLDPMVVGIVPDRACRFLAKDALFRIPGLGWLIRRLGSSPISRESVGARRSLETCVRALERGRALVFFPEGTRSADGRLQPMKRGLDLIVRRSGAPVLPFLVRGTFRGWPRGALLPRPSTIHVHIGELLETESSSPDRAARARSNSTLEHLDVAFRRLAIEAGALEMLGDGSVLEAGEPGAGSSPPASTSREEPDGLPEPAGAASGSPAQPSGRA